MNQQSPCRPLWRALILAAVAAGIPAGPGRAEPREDLRVDYARLGDSDRDVLTTGSLPSAGTLSGGAGSEFAGLVRAGRILVRDTAPTRCLPGDLTRVVADLAARFGPISIESTHRTRVRNRRAGGARRSLHLACRAIDFRAHVPARAAISYLRSRPEVGGLKIYRSGIIHIDNGERRSW